MKMPDFSFENEIWKNGIELVGGCDEVGRGSFAGPVVAAAVAFAPELRIMNYELGIKIDDSKKMTASQRDIADKWIKVNSLSFGIGVGNVNEINKLGIVRATNKAFRRAINEVNIKLKIKNLKLDTLLCDAFYIPNVPGLPKKNQKAIIKGDQKSFSIASASIIAKVYRDKILTDLSDDPIFKVYKWNKNKGYGTKDHREAILKFGTTKYHRLQFVESFLTKFKNKRD